jgi:transcriptional regulator with XRE-family HTH domain
MLRSGTALRQCPVSRSTKAKVQTMLSRQTTARGRALGEELRTWRERANLSAIEIARRLSWSHSKVSNMERGQRAVSEVDAAMYLACCRTPGQDIKEILEFFHAQEGTWLQLHGTQMADMLRSLIALETTAESIHSFELAVIPGLLQTEDYTRALITEGGLAPVEAIGPRTQFRMKRQVLLRRQWPPKCRYFIHESALLLPVGGSKVMNDQLLQLVFASAQRHISIRVVPFSVGPHPGVGGPFNMLKYRNGSPVTYLENDAATLFLDGSPATRYRTHLERLDAIALSEDQSRSFLAHLANEYDRERQNHG